MRDTQKTDDVVTGDQGIGGIKILEILGTRLGQPRVEKGHSALENQVSSVSGSWVQVGAAAAWGSGLGRFLGDNGIRRSRRSTKPGSDGPTTAGGRCTSRGCSSIQL